jgi:D-alanyl-lipoteichoic acid acyltransferase DltB (MBOAT superfamily)
MFTTLEYAGLMTVAAVSVWGLRNRPTFRTLVLIALSSFFFVRANMGHPLIVQSPEKFSAFDALVTCVGLLFCSSLLDFVVAFKIGETTEEEHNTRRALLAVSVTTNLLVLCFFKYFNFFSSSISSLFGIQAPHLDIFCPIGISFYTFQTVSYVTDVYRKKTAPVERYTDYLLFLAFFPKLLMGPLVRANDLVSKLAAPPVLTAENGSRALFRIGIGVVKKFAIAEFLRLHAVDPVFSNPGMYSSLEILFASYAYAFQIYADFSAYTDIAVGSAALLGIEIPENFNAPYISKSLREFWRRWHITLSSWLRDYLYIPLGGSRRPLFFVCLNLMITMMLGGLWHGASLNFLVWGFIHGAALVATHLLAGRRFIALIPERGRNLLGLFLTFHIVTAAWIFFRAPTFKCASEIFNGMAAMQFGTANISPSALLVLFIAALSHAAPRRWFEAAAQGFHRLPSFAQAALFVTIIWGANKAAAVQVSPFIYSQF